MKERGKTTQKVKRGSAQVMVADFITAESGRLIGRPPAAPLEPSATKAKADQACLSRRVNELLDSNDVRAQLLVRLLATDYKWAGSSLITFLGKGLQG
jgi:hypothetical protein